jgi:hypothetical protein
LIKTCLPGETAAHGCNWHECFHTLGVPSGERIARRASTRPAHERDFYQTTTKGFEMWESAAQGRVIADDNEVCFQGMEPGRSCAYPTASFCSCERPSGMKQDRTGRTGLRTRFGSSLRIVGNTSLV